jgi:D-aminoacyl-tRNA deacylase
MNRGGPLMKVVIQRVVNAQVTINDKTTAAIGAGLVVLVGFENADNEETISLASQKILTMRIFEDNDGKMNLSVKNVAGSLLIVPNFTLAADLRKGNRPSFDTSLNPQQARPLFEKLVALFGQSALNVAAGSFGAAMKISLTNNGPVTFILHF